MNLKPGVSSWRFVKIDGNSRIPHKKIKTNIQWPFQEPNLEVPTIFY